MGKSESEEDESGLSDDRSGSDVAIRSDDVVRQFVEHWGMMARSWGINATMGELFALLYITGTDWTADELRERLQVSRGNVSMNLRELMAWGVVHKVHRQGQRREFYRAETDVWTLFRRILSERKRRELDPTLVVLERSVETIHRDPALRELEGRIASLRQFFGLINGLASRLLTLESDDLEELRHLIEFSNGTVPAD
ncbi:GbsR/MarR family transcriptional regulator [Singulisphaera acidiphila]|uniref:HTH-type transcriptional regulator n=1 Tax=Singulisphaera acidiphila (strain ATCC BAA-1392 / DSM 18658 / VKM B-2454 / MOB10) TaxID=886293 RepID=L0DL10_SINAD|nr:transcriptional regulator [Singulisphaera acidiphila]AGA29515.1 putative transcriptional regulator [Singulisphaera acidiphila DSM 18658]